MSWAVLTSLTPPHHRALAFTHQPMVLPSSLALPNVLPLIRLNKQPDAVGPRDEDSCTEYLARLEIATLSTIYRDGLQLRTPTGLVLRPANVTYVAHRHA